MTNKLKAGMELDAKVAGALGLDVRFPRCYSTDDGRALAAVDALLDPIKWGSFSIVGNHNTDWRAVFIPVDKAGGQWAMGTGETRALAISRAIAGMI